MPYRPTPPSHTFLISKYFLSFLFLLLLLLLLLPILLILIRLHLPLQTTLSSLILSPLGFSAINTLQ